MIETILKKLLDRDYPDQFSSYHYFFANTLRFDFENVYITLQFDDQTKIFTMQFFRGKGNEYRECCNHEIKFEDEVEQLRAELNFKSLVQKGIDRLDSEVYAKVMGIEIEPEHPTTFDDAQTQIVNNNVEE